MYVAAAILGIQAEVSQNQVKHMRLWLFECREPSQDAFRLGLGAAAILVMAHVLINLIGGCLCICSQDEFQRSSSTKQISMACLVLTWYVTSNTNLLGINIIVGPKIVFAVGFGSLVIGTMSNSKSRSSCGFTHHHFLSIGGILCFLHALFCVAYYVSATAAKDEAK
ncbi:unnamed protein product [Thlaspi arvense]|uniref:Uncharacterized protein n=1 Tax=Thlaspi arvense TaxID=13288 RepID=A0AAU9SBE4_THLAR|nr:unnamed protein product [Thlaspi arvense]